MDNLYQDWPPAAQPDEAFVANHDDMRRACLDSALSSDNPAVINAMSALMVLVRLVDDPDYLERLADRSAMSGIGSIHVHRIARDEAHRLVDTVLANHRPPALFALEHFIKVARRRYD